MKTTTVRLGADLWALLDAEATRAGVSVSQYLRGAALARAAFAAGARADAPSELLGAWTHTLLDDHPHCLDHATNTELLISALTRPRCRDQREDTTALHAQNRKALTYARALQHQAPSRTSRSMPPSPHTNSRT